MLLLKVHVTPKARQVSIAKMGENEFRVAVKEPPENGKANAAVERTIADHFKVPQSLVCVVRGKTSRSKVVQISAPVKR